MADLPHSIDSTALLTPEVQAIFNALSVPQAESRFVGGCVRDTIMKTPVHDIDMATTLKPDEVMDLLTKAGIRVVPTGIEFGTVTAIFPECSIQITTLRTDKECDGRHALVEYTNNWEEDAKRRDFTVNAMSLNQEGALYDYYGGWQDAQDGVIRFIGDATERIHEDHLRILRFMRFASKISDGVLDKASLKACVEQCHLLGTLSGERIQQEMFKWLEEGIDGVLLLNDDLQPIWQMLFPCKLDIYAYGLITGVEHEGDDLPPLLCLASLISDNQVLIELAKRWKLSKAYTHYLQILSREAKYSRSLEWEREAKSLMVEYGKPLARDILLLAYARQHRDGGMLQDILEFVKAWDIPRFPLTGHDLQSAGIPTGERLGQLLERARHYWKTHDFSPSPEELLEFIHLQNE